eukprot:RCo044433
MFVPLTSHVLHFSLKVSYHVLALCAGFSNLPAHGVPSVRVPLSLSRFAIPVFFPFSQKASVWCSAFGEIAEPLLLSHGPLPFHVARFARFLCVRSSFGSAPPPPPFWMLFGCSRPLPLSSPSPTA